MKFKLSQLENVKPYRVSTKKVDYRSVYDFLCGIGTEYAISILKKNPEDALFHHICAHYQDSNDLSSKNLWKEFFPMDPEMAPLLQAFDFVENENNFESFANSIICESTNTTNTFTVNDFSFSTNKCILSFSENAGKLYCLSYLLTDGFAIFSPIANIASEKLNIKEQAKVIFAATEKSQDNVELAIDNDRFFSLTNDLRTADDEQKNAITADIDKNVLVIAGAGSGKTRSLIGRFSYLHLVRHIPLGRMVLLTFTRAATRKMQQAGISQLTEAYMSSLSSSSSKPYIQASTIDGFFKQILERNWVDIGFIHKPSLMLDQNEQTMKFRYDELRKVIVENHLENVFEGHKISGANGLYECLDQCANGLTVNISGIETLLDLFIERQIKSCFVLDFTYIACILKRVLQNRQGTLYKKICDAYDCILIDEFQDINKLQNDVLSLFYDSRIHFSFVGDDDQTIYTWRGADNSIIKSMQNDETVNTIYLTTNYRNNPYIVNAGNDVLVTLENRAKSDRQIKAYKTSGAKVRITRYDNKYQNLAHEVKKAYDSKKSGEKICVLCRDKIGDKINYITKEVVEGEGTKIRRALEAEGLNVIQQNTDHIYELSQNYKVFKALLFILNKIDMKRNLDYLNEISGKRVSNALLRQYLLGKRKYTPAATELQIGTYTIQKLIELISSININFVFAKDFTELVNNYNRESAQQLENNNSADRNTRDASLNDLYDFSAEYNWEYPVGTKKLKSYFELFEEHTMNTRRKNEEDENPEGIILSTIHKAKGLEYDTVFIVGLNDEEYPNTGMITAEFNRRKFEFEQLKKSKTNLEKLRLTITNSVISNIITECKSQDWGSAQNDMNDFSLDVEAYKAECQRLASDGVEAYIDAYQTYILVYVKSWEDLISKGLKEVSSLQEQADEKEELYHELDDSTEEYKKQYAEWENICKALLKKQSELAGTEQAMKEFLAKISYSTSFYTICCEAKGYLNDISKLRNEQAMLNKLQNDKKNKEEEEKRLFYVAVSRASEKLYLCIRDTANPSPFVSIINTDNCEQYIMHTKNQDEEIARLETLIDTAHEKVSCKKVENKKADKAIEKIVNHDTFQLEMISYVEKYKNEHPQYAQLPDRSNLYFETALKLMGLGEILGYNFKAEIIHNLQRFVEVFLQENIGLKAKPYKLNMDDAMNVVSDIRRTAQKVCKTNVPGEGYLIDLFTKTTKYGDELERCKSLAIECYVVCGGLYSIPSDIKQTWKCKRLLIEPEEFLRASIDIINIRNIVVHNDNEVWLTDYIPYALNCVDVIAAAFGYGDGTFEAIDADGSIAKELNKIIRSYPECFKDEKKLLAVLNDSKIIQSKLAQELSSFGKLGLSCIQNKSILANKEAIVDEMMKNGIQTRSRANQLLILWNLASTIS